MASPRQRVHTDLFEPLPRPLPRPPLEDGPVEQAPPQVRYRRLRELMIVALLALMAVLPAMAMGRYQPMRWPPSPQSYAPSPRPVGGQAPPSPLPYQPLGEQFGEISNETRA
jgi:hypothetical protein